MPSGLRRIYGKGHLHYITCSCYRREQRLGSARSRDVFLHIFEQVRRKCKFVVVGFVVMPEHIHILISEPQIGDPSTVMQVLKQRVARRLLPARRRRAPSKQADLWEEPEGRARHFWQVRFYDFNVFTEKKRIEKLRYMHQNPAKRGLVSAPELWRWSSFRFYAYEEEGPVRLLEEWPEKEPESLGRRTERPPFAGRSHKKLGWSSKEWGTQSLFPDDN